MHFYCIADEDTVRGFRLAGVEGCVVNSGAEAASALEEALARPQAGVLLITQPVAAWIRAKVDAVRHEPDLPLLVEIPGPGGPQPGRRTLRRLVHAAVGMRLERERTTT